MSCVIAQTPLHACRHGDDTGELFQGQSTGARCPELIWCLGINKPLIGQVSAAAPFCNLFWGATSPDTFSARAPTAPVPDLVQPLPRLIRAERTQPMLEQLPSHTDARVVSVKQGSQETVHGRSCPGVSVVCS